MVMLMTGQAGSGYLMENELLKRHIAITNPNRFVSGYADILGNKAW